MSLSLSGLQRIARNGKHSLNQCVVGLTELDPNIKDNRTMIAVISNKLDHAFGLVMKFLDPYLKASELPEGVDDAVVDKALEGISSLFIDLKANCDVLLKGIPYQEIAPLAASSSLDNTVANCSNSCSNPSVSFPKFKLPSFSGDYSQFENFWTRFDSLINKSSNFSILQKFEFLLDQLEDSAFQVVAHLQFKEENYEVAVDLLKKRFSNHRRAATLHACGILNLPKISNDVVSIRKFIDIYTAHIKSLENIHLESQISVYEIIVSQFIMSKFPVELRDKFESRSSSSQFPTAENLIIFLNDYVATLENVRLDDFYNSSYEVPKVNKGGNSNKSFPKNSKKQVNFKNAHNICSLVTSVLPCVICDNSDHDIFKCSLFLSKTPRERYVIVKSKKLCTSCLSAHKGFCKGRKRCSTCKSPGHHLLLHFDTPKSSTSSSGTTTVSEVPAPNTSINEVNFNSDRSCLAVQPSFTKPFQCINVLMATCLVKLQVSPTNFLVVRAILDSASHVSFISEHCAQVLRCHRSSEPTLIKGVGQVLTTSNGVTKLSVETLTGDVISPNQSFIILSNITSNTPRRNISPEVRQRAKNLILADPTFDISAPVDCLLGADLTALVLSGGVVPLGEGYPVAVATRLGYVLMGTAPVHGNGNVSSDRDPSDRLDCCVSLVTDVDSSLNHCVQRFWSLEEPPQRPKSSPEEEHCEEFYKLTTERLPSGRFQVRLPFKENSHSLLGNSFHNALTRFHALERKFARDSTFKDLYVQFMTDYRSQGHMVPFIGNGPPKYIIPHHGVFKSHGDKTKIRVVFDASAKTSSGYSLNDILYTGSSLNSLLSDVFTLFRTFPFVFVCDIEQMFRQVLIHPHDQSYQCILWRDSPDKDIEVYALTTVTYGTCSAPWDAM